MLEFEVEFYFASSKAIGGSKVFKTNGTSVVQVSNVSTTTENPGYFAGLNGEFYFGAFDVNFNYKLTKE